MKITAYKDPVTGLLFEDEGKLATFQANRKREEAAEQRRRAAREAADFSRQTLCRELASVEQFTGLVTQMYQYVLNNTKCKRNKTPLSVTDVQVQRWAVDSGLRLMVDIEVELSGNPETTYSDTFVRMAPTDVLYPFSLYGCGQSSMRGKKLTYSYTLTAKLQDLPLLLATMREAAKLLVAEEAHQKRVDAKTTDLQVNDLPLAELDQVVEDARRTLVAAQDAYAQACGKRRQRADELSAQAAQSMPFPQAAKLAELKAATGLPMVGQTDRWLALGVRNALLARESAEA